MGRLRAVAVIVLGMLVLGGCATAEEIDSSMPPSSPTSTSTQATTTSTPPGTSTTLPTTTTLAPPVAETSTITVESSTITAPTTTTVREADDAAGSGCTVGPGSMPDGHWFGFVEGIDHVSQTISFDLACFFSGDAAERAAAEDGVGFIDYYIRNRSDRLRTIRYDPAATAYWIDATDPDLALQPVLIRQWPAESTASFQEWCPGSGCAAWLEIRGGAVAELIELYLP